ncbi:MAG: hypothetical protein HQK54_15165, partial [Oligoflexales bacterium]|nr:hypothetical protein [Oligoflexales bacterium]
IDGSWVLNNEHYWTQQQAGGNAQTAESVNGQPQQAYTTYQIPMGGNYQTGSNNNSGTTATAPDAVTPQIVQKPVNFSAGMPSGAGSQTVPANAIPTPPQTVSVGQENYCRLNNPQGQTCQEAGVDSGEYCISGLRWGCIGGCAVVVGSCTQY